MRLGLYLLALIVAAAGTAAAVDHPLTGDIVRVKTTSNPNGRRARFRASRDLAIDPGDAPAPTDGGVTTTVEITGLGAGDGSTGVQTLPPSLWTGLGNPPGSKGYRYVDRDATTGIRRVVFKPGPNGGKLVVVGTGLNLDYVVTQEQQGPIRVRFDVGGEVYCALFPGTSFTRNTTDLVVAKNAAAPATCALPVCGNGTVEPPEECDDNNLMDGDGCSSTCTLETTCGNGVAEGDEECDDGDLMSGDGCSATCELEDTSAVCAGVPTVSGDSVDAVLITGALGSNGGPVHITAPPLDPSRVFVVERDGYIRVIKNGTLLPTPFLDIDAKVGSGGSEQGLLSLAFHPDYENNGRFFVNYTNNSGHTVIERYQVSGDPDLADDSSGQILLTIPQDFSNHNGGLNHFGPDGFMYIGMGDGGSGSDPNERAQDPNSLLGKMLRLDVDVETAPYYAVPASNPNPGAGMPLGLIWATGLRNPWRYSFDRLTGDLFIGDVGQGTWEEIDYLPLTGPGWGGENYGWDIFEGNNHCHDPLPHYPTCPSPPTGFTMPIHEYSHSTDGFSCSVTGGYVYRGCRMPDLQGDYFFADFCSDRIRTFEVIGGSAVNLTNRTADLNEPGVGVNSISSFGEDARGELYIADLGGQVFKIVPDSP